MAQELIAAAPHWRALRGTYTGCHGHTPKHWSSEKVCLLHCWHCSFPKQAMQPHFWVALAMIHSATEGGGFRKSRDRDGLLELTEPCCLSQAGPALSFSSRGAWFYEWLKPGSSSLGFGVKYKGVWALVGRAVPAAWPCLSEQEAILRRGGLPSLRAESMGNFLSSLAEELKGQFLSVLLESHSQTRSTCKEIGFIRRDLQTGDVCSMYRTWPVFWVSSA